MNPKRTVIVDGNCFWMKVDSEGGYILGCPITASGKPEWDNTFELDSRAFVNWETFNKFREAIRFLVTYERG